MRLLEGSLGAENVNTLHVDPLKSLELRRFYIGVAFNVVIVDCYKLKKIPFNITRQFIAFFVMKERKNESKQILPF
jgi:hypothetical protein